MGQKDLSEKILVAYNDVFADIVNVLLFNGQEQIQPEELEDRRTKALYRENGMLHEMERDVVKHWRKGEVRFACIGIENQTNQTRGSGITVAFHNGTRLQVYGSNSQRRRKGK